MPKTILILLCAAIMSGCTGSQVHHSDVKAYVQASLDHSFPGVYEVRSADVKDEVALGVNSTPFYLVNYDAAVMVLKTPGEVSLAAIRTVDRNLGGNASFTALWEARSGQSVDISGNLTFRSGEGGWDVGTN